MAPRREVNLVIGTADSDSDISLPDDDYDDTRDKSKGRGKGRADKKKTDKGKGKAKDTVRRTGEPAQNYGSIFSASVYLGSFLHALMGDCAGG